MEIDRKVIKAFFNELNKVFEFHIEQEVQKRIPIEPSEGDINFASKVTGYAKGTIHQYVHRGEIPYSKRGRKLWFKKSELLEWMENRQYF